MLLSLLGNTSMIGVRNHQHHRLLFFSLKGERLFSTKNMNNVPRIKFTFDNDNRQLESGYNTLSSSSSSSFSNGFFGKNDGNAFTSMSAGSASTDSYRKDLYSGRRVTCPKGIASIGLSRMYNIMKGEGIIERIRSKREWTRPGLRKGLERAASKKLRFNAIVRQNIAEIQDIYKKLA